MIRWRGVGTTTKALMVVIVLILSVVKHEERSNNMALMMIHFLMLITTNIYGKSIRFVFGSSNRISLSWFCVLSLCSLCVISVLSLFSVLSVFFCYKTQPWVRCLETLVKVSTLYSNFVLTPNPTWQSDESTLHSLASNQTIHCEIEIYLV